MATTFYVPIERRNLPADSKLRWTILVVDAPDPVTAAHEARRTCDDLPVKGWVVWAAVRDCPTFAHMQELRDSMDACRYSRRAKANHNRIPGYV